MLRVQARCEHHAGFLDFQGRLVLCGLAAQTSSICTAALHLLGYWSLLHVARELIMARPAQGYRLETAETAEFKYEKSAKKAAPVGWEAFNQRTKAEAYDKRADKIPVDLQVHT